MWSLLGSRSNAGDRAGSPPLTRYVCDGPGAQRSKSSSSCLSLPERCPPPSRSSVAARWRVRAAQVRSESRGAHLGALRRGAAHRREAGCGSAWTARPPPASAPPARSLAAQTPTCVPGLPPKSPIPEAAAAMETATRAPSQRQHACSMQARTLVTWRFMAPTTGASASIAAHSERSYDCGCRCLP